MDRRRCSPEGGRGGGGEIVGSLEIGFEVF